MRPGGDAEVEPGNRGGRKKMEEKGRMREGQLGNIQFAFSSPFGLSPPSCYTSSPSLLTHISTHLKRPSKASTVIPGNRSKGKRKCLKWKRARGDGGMGRRRTDVVPNPSTQAAQGEGPEHDAQWLRNLQLQVVGPRLQVEGEDDGVGDDGHVDREPEV